MKNLILLGLLASFSLASLNSCVKTTKCDCPSGKSLSVSGSTDEEIRANCEVKSGGDCTH